MSCAVSADHVRNHGPSSGRCPGLLSPLPPGPARDCAMDAGACHAWIGASLAACAARACAERAGARASARAERARAHEQALSPAPTRPVLPANVRHPRAAAIPSAAHSGYRAAGLAASAARKARSCWVSPRGQALSPAPAATSLCPSPRLLPLRWPQVPVAHAAARAQAELAGCARSIEGLPDLRGYVAPPLPASVPRFAARCPAASATPALVVTVPQPPRGAPAVAAGADALTATLPGSRSRAGAADAKLPVPAPAEPPAAPPGAPPAAPPGAPPAAPPGAPPAAPPGAPPAAPPGAPVDIVAPAGDAARGPQEAARGPQAAVPKEVPVIDEHEPEACAAGADDPRSPVAPRSQRTRRAAAPPPRPPCAAAPPRGSAARRAAKRASAAAKGGGRRRA